MKPSIPLLLFGLLLLAGILVRLPQITYGLPASLSSDRVNTVGVSLQLEREWKCGHFTFRRNNHLYPGLFINGLAFALYLTPDHVSSEAVGRFWATLFGLLTAFWAFALAKRLHSVGAGLVAVTIISLGLLFVRMGRTPAPDPLLLFLTAGSFYFLLRNENVTRTDMQWSGILAGLGVGTKYTSVIFLLPALITVLAAAFRPRQWRQILFFAVLWSAAVLLGFIIATPDFLIDAKAYMNILRDNNLAQRTGMIDNLSIAPFDLLFSKRSLPTDAPFSSSLGGQLGLGLIIVSILDGAWLSFRKSNRRICALGIAAICSYFFFSHHRIYGVRFLFPLAFILVVMAAVSLSTIANLITAQIPKTLGSAHPAYVLTFLTLILLGPTLALTTRYIVAEQKPDTRLLAATWIIQNVPAKSRILNFMHGPALPSQLFNVVTEDFPEYRLQLLPDDSQAPSLSKIRAQNVGYLIWNDFYTNRYLTSGPDSELPYVRAWKKFKSDLDQHCETKAQFEGDISPTITIYRLN